MVSSRHPSFTLAALTAVVVFAAGCAVIAMLPRTYAATAVAGFAPAGADDDAMVAGGFPAQSEVAYLISSDLLAPVVEQLRPGTERALALAALKQNLQLRNRPGTGLIDITVTDRNPSDAARFANAIADRYVLVRDASIQARGQRGAATLRQRIADQEALVAQEQTGLGKMPSADSPARRDAQHNLDEAQRTLASMRSSYNQGDLQPTPFRIMERAAAPNRPLRPNLPLCYTLAALAALVIGSVVARVRA
jgi:capsular polysaccharide biosynthesis protein